MSSYKITIGLEIHAELKTQSKMFCGCINSPEEKTPNTHTCPVCMGHPGTLPVINKEAVKKVLLVGLALNSTLADFTEFDRKNYFYPDIPKGYQISQYKHPLIQGGTLNGVEITRIHLEEDTARSLHGGGGNFQFPISNENSNIENSMKIAKLKTENSLIDFNRAGVPLMELVTEPVIHSSEEAVKFAKEFQLLLQYLGVSDANMEKGEMRVEVNFSVSNNDKLGTKVEIKNINSFKAAGKAIDYEFERHVEMLERGEKIVQETRGWDENKEITFSQRLKESAHDYRYFEDPDLPKLVISEIPEFSREELKKLLVELPEEKRKRLTKDFGLKSEDVEMYVGDKSVGKFFEEIVGGLLEQGTEIIKTASNYITSDIVGLSKSVGRDFTFGKINKENFVRLMGMISKGELSSRGAKDILKIMFDDGGDPTTLANERGLIQKNDIKEIKTLAEKIIKENSKAVDEYKKGKQSLLQFLVGQGMKESKGSINPDLFKKTLLELLTK